jgi:hypothetical protein
MDWQFSGLIRDGGSSKLGFAGFSGVSDGGLDATSP